jgi:hypothetical protein
MVVPSWYLFVFLRLQVTSDVSGRRETDTSNIFLGSHEMSLRVFGGNGTDFTEWWLNINTASYGPPFETSRGLHMTNGSAMPSHFTSLYTVPT